MAKQKLKTTLTTVEEVNVQLRELAKMEAFISEQEADLNRELLAVEKKFNNATKVWIEKKNAILQNLELWSDEHKKEFKQSATGGSVLNLIYGSLAFRKSTGKIEMLRKVKDGLKAAAKDLKDMFQNKYVREIYEVNKEALLEDYRSGKVGDMELASVNLKINDDTIFTAKINWKKLEKEGLKLVEVKKAV
jgi:phage host-nuclease inhibitor protein Gam